jgi:hypothetical protein
MMVELHAFFDLGTRWRWVVSFTSLPLYPQVKSLWYPSDRRLGGPQSRSGCGGEEKNSQPLPGQEPSIIQPVAQHYTTELIRLLKVRCMFSYHAYNVQEKQALDEHADYILASRNVET